MTKDIQDYFRRCSRLCRLFMSSISISGTSCTTGILILRLTEGANHIDFVDKIVAVVTARTQVQTQRRTLQVLPSRAVRDWFYEHGLDLTENKTEMVVLGGSGTSVIIY